MKIKSAAAKLLKPGLCAMFAFAYYIPKKKSIKKLLKKRPGGAQDLWIDAFHVGVEWGRNHPITDTVSYDERDE